jgi:DNA-binding NtrC family response regulator
VGGYETPDTLRLQSIDVRIVAATSWNLQAEVAAGRFNPDLYQHLNAVGLHMPPLRERLADLDTLCEHLLDALAQKLRLPPLEIAPEALDRLAQYDWPGNVRELSNVLEHVLLVGDADTITAEDVNAVLPARNATLIGNP